MIDIRPATLDDVPALPEIERSAGEAFRATPHAWVADDEETPAEFYPARVKAGNVLVAEVAGQLAGFVDANVKGGDLHVWSLDVRFELQGRGIGRALMAAARQRAIQLGCKGMTLTTFVDVPFNAPFYQSLGFSILPAPPRRLAEILATEAARGLTNRCAMRAPL
jgi:GNAT superfamily N-acetyltransferase